MAGWLHGVFLGEWLFVFPLCGFSLSLFCDFMRRVGAGHAYLRCTQHTPLTGFASWCVRCQPPPDPGTPGVSCTSIPAGRRCRGASFRSALLPGTRRGVRATDM